MATTLSLKSMSELGADAMSNAAAFRVCLWVPPSRRALISSAVLHLAGLSGLWLLYTGGAGTTFDPTAEQSAPKDFVLIYQPTKVRQVRRSEIRNNSLRQPAVRKELKPPQASALANRNFDAVKAPLIEGEIRSAGLLPNSLIAPAPSQLVGAAGFDLAAAPRAGKEDGQPPNGASVGKFGEPGTGHRREGVEQGAFSVGRFDSGTGAVKPPLASTMAAMTSDLEILEFPKPRYTDEAREHHIEGKVSIQAAFHKDGTVDGMKVLRGLGYGLDEKALDAVKRIRFKVGECRDPELEVRILTITVNFRLAD